MVNVLLTCIMCDQRKKNGHLFVGQSQISTMSIFNGFLEVRETFLFVLTVIFLCTNHIAPAEHVFPLLTEGLSNCP